MKLPRRDNFCIWQRALPRSRPCRGSLGRKPIRRGRCASSLAFRRAARPTSRAPDGSMAVGASWPAIHRREPARRRRQYRRRGGRERSAGRLYAPLDYVSRTQSTRHSTTSSVSISSATSRRSQASAATACHGGESRRLRPSPFPSSSPMPRLIRASSTWRRLETEPRLMWLASCSR